MLVATVALVALAPLSWQTPPPAVPAARSVLVFSKTSGFRHDSIPAARQALLKIAQERRWSMTFTEDSTWFAAAKLQPYDAVVFLMTTGDVLNAEQEGALEGFVRAGGGYVGIHAAADTEYDWEWYGRLVGAYFLSHPAIQDATVLTEDREHPTTSFLPSPWNRRDEWYDYRSNPRGQVHVLQTLDESTYKGGRMGKDHPITWCHDFDGGRSWYTGMGHTAESYEEPLFMRMIAEAIEWASSKSAVDAPREKRPAGALLAPLRNVSSCDSCIG
jgi:cytochrome c